MWQRLYGYMLLIVPYVYYLTYYLITLGLCNFFFLVCLLLIIILEMTKT